MVANTGVDCGEDGHASGVWALVILLVGVLFIGVGCGGGGGGGTTLNPIGPVTGADTLTNLSGHVSFQGRPMANAAVFLIAPAHAGCRRSKGIPAPPGATAGGRGNQPAATAFPITTWVSIWARILPMISSGATPSASPSKFMMSRWRRAGRATALISSKETWFCPLR